MELKRHSLADIMAFGAHPDDVEIGAAGTLAKLASSGGSIVLCDLTAGEMASNGTPATRREEALAAAEIMGVDLRICLGIPELDLGKTDQYAEAVVEVIRRHRPRLVLAPWKQDRHPGHGHGARLVQEACFLAGLSAFQPETGEPHRPEKILSYMVNSQSRPDILVDISEYWEVKVEALKAHQSQFSPKGRVATILNSPAYLKGIEARDRYFGSLVGKGFAEGFVSGEPMIIGNLLDLL